MGEFSSKSGVAVVTGGSGGVGAAIVKKFLAEGSRVVLTYNRNVPDFLDEYGSDAEAHQLDLTDADAAREFIEATVKSHGGIHTLVHAAGPHVPMVYISKMTPEQFSDQVDADVKGFFNIVHPTLPALRESAGSIVVVTTAATARYPTRDGLSASPKGAVEQLARGIAVEEGRFGIRVNCVGPGMLSDGMSARLQASGQIDEKALAITLNNIPLRKMGSSVDIAEAASFLASDRAGFISGQKLDIDGGYSV